MSIKLNHTIVPAKDKEAAASFFAKIFGLNYDGPMGHFAPVRINDELTLDFDNAESFEPHHYAFHVSDDDFDAIFRRIQEAGITWGSEPRSSDERPVEYSQGRPRCLLSWSRRPLARTAHTAVSELTIAALFTGTSERTVIAELSVCRGSRHHIGFSC